ncbi:tyrosine-type recombinase/integrase [Brucella sp. JSBI001]|jgi:integrase|uniref:tyrosine-type recombinase/integrase n=1 Tax=Brucella sp. JSBI001 TaxID=2886044 RepID=UPI002230FECE|nr:MULTISPECIES: integrase arm-type DNA-binding domain-containing protein [Brucella]UZD69301.1 integrase arm-type DNA-binding domain-containing protein [Brucella sp. JSBI001]
MALTDTAIKNLKPQNAAKKYSDGGGLHLLVSPTGSKLWRLAYRFNGKQKLLAFGAYPSVSLADARRRREDAKTLLATGTDPSEQVKADRRRQRVSSANTFDAIADELLEKFEREGRAETTMIKKRWLLDLIRPAIGSRPIAEITAAEVLEPLRAVEAEGNYETARRMRSTAGQVFRYAIATSRADNDPTGALRGALTTPTVTHHAAITNPQAFGGLLRAVWAYEGTPETKAALQLMAMLYPRPGELRKAHWSEFDLDAATWTIPAARMKMRRGHVKPLPTQAVGLLRELHKHTGDGSLVFPSIKSRKQPISENTLNGALRRLGFTSEEMTSHGFRASASTMLNESKKWPADAIEAELAHVGADQVRRVYHRALYWDDRVKMAQAWADDIDALRNQGVGAFG